MAVTGGIGQLGAGSVKKYRGAKWRPCTLCDWPFSAAPRALSVIGALLDQLDLVAVRIGDERDDSGAALDGPRLARDRAAQCRRLLANGRTGGRHVGHTHGDVTVSRP